MAIVRDIASYGLALRAKEGVKVRQPLSSLTIQEKLDKKLQDVLKDELNVKRVVVDAKAKQPLSLDFTLSAELKEEGLVRELLRLVQGMRKDAGLNPGEKARMRYAGDREIVGVIAKHEKLFRQAASLSAVQEGDRPKQVFDVERETRLDGKRLWAGLRKG